MVVPQPAQKWHGPNLALEETVVDASGWWGARSLACATGEQGLGRVRAAPM